MKINNNNRCCMCICMHVIAAWRHRAHHTVQATNKQAHFTTKKHECCHNKRHECWTPGLAQIDTSAANYCASIFQQLTHNLGCSTGLFHGGTVCWDISHKCCAHSCAHAYTHTMLTWLHVAAVRLSSLPSSCVSHTSENINHQPADTLARS